MIPNSSSVFTTGTQNFQDFSWFLAYNLKQMGQQESHSDWDVCEVFSMPAFIAMSSIPSKPIQCFYKRKKV